MKIFQRSQKDFGKKLLEDLPKKINVVLLKVFRRKSFYENLQKIFRRMRSREDLHKRSLRDLNLRKISKKDSGPGIRLWVNKYYTYTSLLHLELGFHVAIR